MVGIPGLVTQNELNDDNVRLLTAQAKLVTASVNADVKSAEVDSAAKAMGLDRDTFLRLGGNYDKEKSGIAAVRSSYEKDGSRARADLQDLRSNITDKLSDTAAGLFMIHCNQAVTPELRADIGDEAADAICSFQSQRGEIDKRLKSAQAGLTDLKNKDQRLDKINNIYKAYKQLTAEKSSAQKEVNAAQAELTSDLAWFNGRMEKQAAAADGVGSAFSSAGRWFQSQADSWRSAEHH